MVNERALRSYLLKEFPGAYDIRITKLGAGVQGAGFLIELTTPEGGRTYVVKGLFPEGLGHDYPSDRASVFLLDLDEYGNLPRHVRAVDVLSEMEDGTIKSVGGGKEYYLLMERVEGRHYFHDLSDMSVRDSLEPADREKIRALSSYLAEIHAVKKESRTLYWRKLRDTIGHGECLMGVFDLYPDGTMSYGEMADVEKLCVDWRARLKLCTYRLSQIHGDFHPGNIWFTGDADFVLLDRSRGPWGEPADDVTALAINYIFFSLKNYGDVRKAYKEGLTMFFDEYIRASGDREITKVSPLFFAFRAAVVANPVFYPDLSRETRGKIFRFMRNVLLSEDFEVDKVNQYISG
ncbi:MAG: phosphotransferase [Candidatus Sulfobium sp.]|jgi:aminoglycoside phosphotransferase (APT) family kinase protein